MCSCLSFSPPNGLCVRRPLAECSSAVELHAHLTDCKSIAFNVNNLEISVQTSRLTEMNVFFLHFIASCHTASLMSSRRKFW